MAAKSTYQTADLVDAMERYVDGDPRGFRQVYAAMAPVVRRCLMRWMGYADQAEDLVQETFVRVHRARNRYRRGAPVGPWILTIARRLSIDALRRRGRSKERLTREGRLPENAAPDTAPSPLETEALIREVRAAVDELPNSLKQVVAMHKLDGRPLSAVADALGIKEGAARVRAHRGYQRLKTILAKRFGAGEG